MTKKELQRIYLLDLRISADIKELEKLNSLKYSIRSPSAYSEKVQSSVRNDNDLIERIVDLECSINKRISELIDLRECYKKKICGVDGEYGVLLNLRYVQCLKWQDIAKIMHRSEQTIFRLHGEALSLIKDL
jgi:DNA-directed RNA polymerase specialized sigma subunit